MSGDDDSAFKLVVSRRHGRRKLPAATGRKACTFVALGQTQPADAMESPPSVDAIGEVLAQVATASAVVKRYDFLIDALVSAIRDFVLSVTEGTVLPPSAPIQVTSLGIGSIHSSSNARVQLAALLEVQAVLLTEHGLHLLVTHFDPAFSMLDVGALRALGHDALPASPYSDSSVPPPRPPSAPATAVSAPRIYFMIHCNTSLCEEVLRSHWGPALERVCIIGNSLRWIAEQRGADTCARAVNALLFHQPTRRDVPVLTGSDLTSLTPHVDAAAGSVVGHTPADAAIEKSSGGAGCTSNPLVVRERALGVTARDSDREYQPLYMAFEATSSLSFTWRKVVAAGADEGCGRTEGAPASASTSGVV